MNPIDPAQFLDETKVSSGHPTSPLASVASVVEETFLSEESILYAEECPPDRARFNSYLFLLGSPDNTPPPCTRRRWLEWRRGLTGDRLQAYRLREGLTEEQLDEVISLDSCDAFRATGWALEGPQGKAYRFLKRISNRLGGQTAPNWPNHRMTDIVFQEFPSSLRGWVAAYARSPEALTNLQSLFDELGEATRIAVIPIETTP